MIIERAWAMPSKNTFSIKPIREMIFDEANFMKLWIDPFANESRLASVTNDLNPDFDTDYHMDALDFLKMYGDNSVDGVLYDPPYSNRQISEVYHSVGMPVGKETTSTKFYSLQRAEISRIVKPGGKVLCFGWNSNGIGKKYGFEMTRVLLVAHGGGHNDTICTVEVKVAE